MNLVVISCWNYRDVWKPFFALLDHFWPNHPETVLITDKPGQEKTWCETLLDHCRSVSQPFIMLQEDFFLSAPVKQDLIDICIKAFYRYRPGCLRIYPCPGADLPLTDYECIGKMSRNAPYRISCQAAIWNPRYLTAILSNVHGMAYDFEIFGQDKARSLPCEVLAWQRDCEPWPMEYLCSAISRGQWNPDAKHICDAVGIEADWTARPFVSA